ncbi:hypothetical protein ACXC9Q_23205 (plasmid) [Kribbella sp. CWNU-51]
MPTLFHGIDAYVTDARILHNEISDVPYDGIDTGYGWGINDAGGSNDYVDRGYYNRNPLYTTPTTLKDNRVEGNLVHNTKARFADGGSVYNLSASPGTVVSKNYSLFNISGIGLWFRRRQPPDFRRRGSMYDVCPAV